MTFKLVSGGIFSVGSGRVWGKWSKGLVSDWLKAGVISYIYVAEGVNGSLKS